MYRTCVFLLILSLFTSRKCNADKPTLQIIKCADSSFTPVTLPVVEEKAGANFSLLCDLVSSEMNRKYFDFQISWFKQSKSNDLRIWREQNSSDSKRYSILQPSEMNKAIKQFNPLRAEDRGKYFCVSLKYDLYQVVELVVREENPQIEDRAPYQESRSCSDQMFRCFSGFCIYQRYLCDGKSDCTDGSDESFETCKGAPCRDKLQCEDGRCIPMSWCCDRHHDPNCTVNNRPTCCQELSDSYEELEAPAVLQGQHTGARYLFITICTLCVLFVILLFLVVASRVVLMARKSDPGAEVESIRCEVYAPATPDDDVSDPLLFTREEERPPSYLEVMRAGLNEPPPPYSSREVLSE